jgi:serine/threonine protein kinase
MIENGTLLQDRYLIEKQIGAGGMGAVYLAVDQRFGSYVAIKETFYSDDEFGDAFEREAHLLNSLHHPALPHVSDYFTESEGHFLVMQFIEGEDLSAILKREGAFPVKDVLRWTDSLLDALDYLHSQEPPIIHRDIKPQNLKLTPRGDIILLDFGLAKLKSEDTSGVKSVFGYSRKYSPLEQIQGTGTDARSDIFSLGATAYQLLTGKPPIDVLARAAEIVVGNPDPLHLVSEINSDVPVPVANVLNSALALNAAARFVSAKAMRQALEYAVNIDSPEKFEELPDETAAVIAPAEGVIVSPEKENFPALEAFAAEAAINLPDEVENVKPKAIETPTVLPETSSEASEMPPQSTSNIETPTVIAAPRPLQKRFPIAALVALLICVGLAAGYFIKKANSNGNPSETPVIQPKPETNPNIGQSETVSESTVPDEPAETNIENTEQARNRPVQSEKTVERKTAAEEPIVREEKNDNPASARLENKKSAPVQNPRRGNSKGNGEIRDRVVVNEPVPDIESVFTGRPSRYKNEKVRRRNNEMSEEEWEEFRRQRQKERRQRQNARPFPF